MNILRLTVVVGSLSVTMLSSCTKTETVEAPNRITEFKITNVPEGKDPIYGAINDNDNTIKVYLPFFYYLPVIIPEIKTSAGASVTPSNREVSGNLFDAFKTGQPLTYVVKPVTGPERIYTLHVETQQGELKLNEVNSDPVTPKEYILDYTNTNDQSFDIGLRGQNIVPALDLTGVILIDQATKKEYDMKEAFLSVNNNITGISITFSIGKYNYRSKPAEEPPVETNVARSLPDNAVYTIKVYNYASQTTLKNTIRIIKKKSL